MKINIPIKTTKTHLALIGSVCAMLCVDGLSQGVDLVEDEANDDKNEINIAKMKNLPDPKPVTAEASRYAGEEELEQYIIDRAAVFSMRDRDADPFMLAQDPTAKPVENKIASRRVNRRAALPPTPLAEVIKLINVTTIMPSEKKFLVGIREFKELDEFPLEYQGKVIQIKIVEVSTRNIVFRDIEKGEEATLTTRILPPGMETGGDKLQPPGMISPNSNLPLQLGSGDRLSNMNN